MSGSHRTASMSVLAAAARPVVEALEQRRLLAASPLPFLLDFDASGAGGIEDQHGESTGFTGVQANRLGTEYQPGLIDLDTAGGVLHVTTGAGSNFDADNTLLNGLLMEFDGATGGFAITARLVGPLTQLDAPFEQAGIMFGPDQDNYVKFVAVARSNGQFLQFNDEQTTAGSTTHTVDQVVSVGPFGSLATLDLRLVADASSGRVTAQYAVDGGDFTTVSGAVLTLSAAKKAEFFNAASRGGLIAMHKGSSTPVTVAFDEFEVRQRPSISAIVPSDGQTNVRRDVFVGADLFLPNGALDPATVDGTTVKLYKTATGALVAGTANTSGGGDSIVLQPTNVLDPDTQYTFEVTAGVQDVGGFALLPFKMTFTTGTEGGPTVTNTEFEKVVLPSTALGYNYTAVNVGPDNRVYAGTVDGRIVRYDINPDGTLGEGQVINSLRDANGGPRLMEGFVFDPSSTADNLILWVTHGYFDFDAAPEWSSKITRLSGPNLEVVQDAVIGLPRSAHNHLVNQPIFGPVEPDGKRYLYFTQAGNTAQGAMDSTWGLRPERLLSAAVLKLDVSALTPGTPLNVQTEERGSANYNPWAPGAPLTIYATGLRNSYDLVWTHDGYLYAANNGSNPGGATPATPGLPIPGSIRIDGDDDGNPANGHYSGPAVPGINPLNEGQPDYLYKVDAGGYYGHPNPTRYEYVLNGGNPTAGADPYEIKSYPVGVLPDRNFRGAAFNFGAKYSPNGIMEFRGDAFGGALDGALMVTRFSGGDDVVILKRAADGSIVEMQTGIAGLTGFADPLDLTQDQGTGFIYVAEYAGKRLTLVRPLAAPDAPEGVTATGTGPTRVVVQWEPVVTAASYRVERRGPGEADFTEVGVVSAATFVDTGATALQTYEYRVRAENNGGVSAFSAAVSATTTPPGQWSQGDPIPEAIAEAGGDIINGKLYVVGESTPDTWEYDFATGVWTAKAIRDFTGDASNAEHATHAVNGKLYLIGGLSGGSENKVQIYDPATDTWSLGADRPWNGGSSVSAVIDGEIYVAGGAVTTPTYTAVNRVGKYNPATNTWTELAAMPSPRHATLGGTDGERLWVFGGRDKGLEASDGTSTVQVYDPLTNTWQTSDNVASGLAPMPRPVRGVSVAFYGGEFYVFGGENSTGGHDATADKVFDRVDVYNPATNTWRLGKPMPTARHATAAVVHQDKIYLIGGGTVSGTSFSTGVEVFDALANPVPLAPTELSAITISPTRIDLGWSDPADNEVEFQILRSLDGESFTLLDTVAANVTTYSDTTVVDDTGYFYVVRAVNAAGTSDPSNAASAVAGEPQPPVTPGNLTANPVSTTRVLLDWQSSVGATLYYVERKGPNDADFILIGTTAQSEFQDTGLVKDTTYSYRVRAENLAGFSGYSSVATATTPLSVPMSSIDIDTAVSGSTTVVVEGRDFDVTGGGVNIWDTSDSFRFVYGEMSGDFDIMVQVRDVSMDEVKAGLMARESLAANSRHAYSSISSGDSHRLAYRQATGGQTANAFKAVTPVLPNVWLRLKRVGDSFLGFYSTNGTNWVSMGEVVMVSAMPHTLYVGLAVSAQSSTQTGTVQFRNLDDVPGTAPAAPINVTATPVSHAQVNLAWGAAATATNYRVQRRLGSGAFEDVALVSGTSFNDTGLTGSTSYDYQVIVEHQYGASLPSLIASATTQDAPAAPAAPTGVVATAFSYGQIDLSWNVTPGATSYTVQRRLAGGGGGSFADLLTGLTGTAHSDAGLSAGTAYEYQVIAVNDIGASAASTVAAATTDAAPTAAPAAPTGLGATPVSADRIDLAWDKAAGAGTYRVQRRLAGGTASFVDVAINVASLGYSDLGLAGDTAYEYRVLAENTLGPSAPSTAVTATTPAPAHVGADIGSPSVAGSTTPFGTGGTGYDVVGGGTDIYGTSDQFHFAYRQLTGDFDIRVRVESLATADAWTKAGLMARESLAATSRNVFVLATGANKNEHRFTSRATTGGTTASTGGGPVSYPNTWLRLQRVGDAFAGYRSTDGVNWTQVGSVTMALPGTLYFGMAVTSHKSSASATAQFRNLSNTPAPAAPVGVTAAAASSDAALLQWAAAGGASLYRVERMGPGDAAFVEVGTTAATSYLDAGLAPGGTYQYRVISANALGASDPSAATSVVLPNVGTFVGTDIGGPVLSGSTSPVSGGFDVTAGGADIWGNADELHFVNDRLTGDFDVMVRVQDVSADGAKVGLMVRESLAADSRNVFVGRMTSDGYRMSTRAATGGSTGNAYQGGAAVVPNVWLRLRRAGDVFTGYFSTDGANWTPMTGVTMVLPQTVYLGMAASARSTTTPVAVQFRDIAPVPSSAPAAPTDLAAVPTSDTRIDLTWTASPGQNAYRVERRTGGGAWAVVASGLTTTSYADTGLSPDTAYEYQVVAANVAGTSAPSSIATATTLPPSVVPSAPTGLAASALAAGSVELTWNAAGGAASYVVQRRTIGGTFADVATGVTATTFTDTGVSAATTYEYQVIAVNAAGPSGPSNIASATTPAASAYIGADVGSVGVPGSTVAVGADGFDVTGSGADIWGSADQFHFAYRQLTGDFDVVVQIASVSLSQAKAGLMARESLNANSRHVFAGIGADDAYRLANRTSTGGSSRNVWKSVTPVLPNVWVRLRRVGDTFTGFYSTDGASWTKMKDTSVSLPDTVYFGMAVSSKNDAQAATAQFRHLGDFGAPAPTAAGSLFATGSPITLDWDTTPAALDEEDTIGLLA